jgi:hypothetical protein
MRRHEKVERRARALLRRYLIEEIDKVTCGYLWADRRFANLQDDEVLLRRMSEDFDQFGDTAQRCQRLSELLASLRQCEQPRKGTRHAPDR